MKFYFKRRMQFNVEYVELENLKKQYRKLKSLSQSVTSSNYS